MSLEIFIVSRIFFSPVVVNDKTGGCSEFKWIYFLTTSTFHEAETLNKKRQTKISLVVGRFVEPWNGANLMSLQSRGSLGAKTHKNNTNVWNKILDLNSNKNKFLWSDLVC